MVLRRHAPNHVASSTSSAGVVTDVEVMKNSGARRALLTLHEKGVLTPLWVDWLGSVEFLDERDFLQLKGAGRVYFMDVKIAHGQEDLPNQLWFASERNSKVMKRLLKPSKRSVEDRKAVAEACEKVESGQRREIASFLILESERNPLPRDKPESELITPFDLKVLMMMNGGGVSLNALVARMGGIENCTPEQVSYSLAKLVDYLFADVGEAVAVSLRGADKREPSLVFYATKAKNALLVELAEEWAKHGGKLHENRLSQAGFALDGRTIVPPFKIEKHSPEPQPRAEPQVPRRLEEFDGLPA